MLDRRRRETEWMDAPNVDPRLLRRSLSFIQIVNRFLGYTRATLRHLDQFSRSWTLDQRIDIIDLATGSADVPRAVLRWADRHGFNIAITAVDLHAATADIARQENR